jgi:hypothetical protein
MLRPQPREEETTVAVSHGLLKALIIGLPFSLMLWAAIISVIGSIFK